MNMQIQQVKQPTSQIGRWKSVLRISDQVQRSLQQSICGIPRNKAAKSGLSVDRLRLWITFLGESKKNSTKVIDSKTLQICHSKCNGYDSRVGWVVLVSWLEMIRNISKAIEKSSVFVVVVMPKQMHPSPNCE